MSEEELDEYIKSNEEEFIRDFDFACKCYFLEKIKELDLNE